MATAVIQVHVERLPSRIPVAPTYTRAYVVLRRGGQPVARFDLPVTNGCVDPASFVEMLAKEVRHSGGHWLVRDYLGPDPPGLTGDTTVAICTHERSGDLRRALIAVQRLDPAPLEVVVVDNAPRSNATRDVVAEYERVRYVCEPRQGLDCARNRALREARGQVIAFTDDDAVPEPGWLGALMAPFADTRVWCTTGLTLPAELETPAQEAFERYNSFTRGFRRRVFDGARHDGLSVGSAGAGANMAVRRAVLTALGGFDEALDAGTATRSGGDHEMFGRILAAGHNIVYEPAAVSWHRHRRSWPELRETLQGYGTGVFAVVTRRVLHDRELLAVRHGLRWLYGHHLRNLWAALRKHPDTAPLDLVLAEIAGCLAGPGAYARSRRGLRAHPTRS